MHLRQADFNISNTNILFAGFMVDDQTFDRVAKQDPSPQYAAQNYQKNLVNLLQRGSWKSFSVFGSVPCSPYPKNPTIYMPPKSWGERGDRCSGPVFNVVGFNLLVRSIGLLFFLVAWFFKNKGDKVVFLYALHSPHVLPILIAKILTRIKVVVYIPDLPMYMNFGSEGGVLRRLMKRLDSMFLLFACNRFDGRVVITPSMYDFVVRQHSVVVDTIVDEVNELKECRSFDMPAGVNFTYTGGLRDGYGVREALDYFSSDVAKANGWNLLVFGAGPLRDLCIRYSDLHENIFFYGQIPIENARLVQSRSDFLLNLRDPSDERFNYSYPSKITEYLLSGVPVVTTRIAGIPDDFNPYLNFVDLNEFGVEGFIGNYPKIQENARKGRRHLLSSRSPEVQFEKLVTLIKECWSF
ncbi:glycosyltransferase [Marinobacter mobilis]|uniref:glycosyltransferase n=1 Tax=Marinobacter mobilis TaxID=488533 RepID=UPI0035C684F6